MTFLKSLTDIPPHWPVTVWYELQTGEYLATIKVFFERARDVLPVAQHDGLRLEAVCWEYGNRLFADYW